MRRCKLKGREHLRDLGVGGMQDNIEIDFKETGCEQDSGYIKGEEFLDYLYDYQLLKKDCAPWSSLLQTVLLSTNGILSCTVGRIGEERGKVDLFKVFREEAADICRSEHGNCATR
jgi:hypothetical protein